MDTLPMISCPIFADLTFSWLTGPITEIPTKKIPPTYQLSPMLNVRLLNRGVLNRSSVDILCSMAVFSTSVVAAGHSSAVADEVNASRSWFTLMPSAGMRCDLLLRVRVFLTMASASLYRPWAKSHRGDSSTNLKKQTKGKRSHINDSVVDHV